MASSLSYPRPNNSAVEKSDPERHPLRLHAFKKGLRRSPAQNSLSKHGYDEMGRLRPSYAEIAVNAGWRNSQNHRWLFGL